MSARPLCAQGVLLVGLLALCGRSPLCAQAETLPSYQARISRWAQRLDAARGQLARRDAAWPNTIETVARDASAECEVERAAARAISVDHGWLTQRLREALAAPDPGRAADSLQAAAEQLAAYREALVPAAAPDRDRVRAILKRVLPTKRAGRSLSSAWLGRMLERIFGWLDRVLGRLSLEPGPRRNFVFWLIVGLGAGLLLAALSLALRALLRRFDRGARVAPAGAETGFPLAPPDPDTLLARARQAASSGLHGEAIRHLYLALLLKLDLAGLLRYHPAKTNWEYLRGLPEGELQRPLTSLTTIFDRKCYGAEPADRTEYLQCEQLYERVLAEVGAA